MNSNNQKNFQFCPFCGASLKTGANFCPKCGHSLTNRKEAVSTHTDFSDNPPPLFNKNQKIGMLIGVGLFCAVLGIFAYSNHEDNSAKQYSPATTAVNSQDTYQNRKPVDVKSADPVETPKSQEKTESSSENTVKHYSSGRAISYRNDMENYNNAIVNFSSELNQYLQRSSDFSGTSYDTEGRNILYNIQSERNSLAQENDIDNDEKGELLHLYDLEITRIQGMIEGIVSSKNGGSFANGFRNGTQASYELDNAVAAYRNEYAQ